jgi:hypothetical protein
MIRIFPRLFEQGRVWQESTISNTEFIRKYKEHLENLIIGCSFSPEHIEYLLEQVKNQNAKVKNTSQKSQFTLDCLKAVVEEFNIRDLRLGIRWNSVDLPAGRQAGKSIDLSYYKPFLDYCFEKKVNITLNVGPIKIFRWPEQYVPEYILQKIELPKKGSQIIPESELAKDAKAYLEKLYQVLKSTYTEKQLAQIKIIQIENEPFHRFGEYEWRMSEEYMTALYNLTLKYFPHVSFLINSSETRNIAKTAHFYQRIISKNKKLKHRLILGYNFFYKVPHARTVPILGTFDSISLTNLSRKKLCRKNIDWAQDIGYAIEVTEAQTEPWLPIITPGNSAQEFRFLLLRSVYHLLDGRKKSLMRIWGIEHLVLAKKMKMLTPDQQQIIELIQRINTGE